MKAHITKTVSACFVILRQLRSICRSASRSVLQSLVVSLVLSRVIYGNATLVGVPLYQLKRLQSVMNSAAQLVFSSSKFDHITPLLRRLHWLKSQNGFSTSSPRSGFQMLQLRRTWSMNYSRPRTLGLDLAYYQRRRYQCLSAVHGCQPSLIELFQSPLLVPGTVCCAASRPHHR